MSSKGTLTDDYYFTKAINVSEESGKVSIAKDGTLIADVKEEALKKILIKNIVTDRLENKKENKIKRLKNIKKIKSEKKATEEQTKINN